MKKLLLILCFLVTSICYSAGINDTGVVLCASLENMNLSCNNSDTIKGQDGFYGRDKNIKSSTKIGYGSTNGFDFTKLSSIGIPTNSSNSNYSCIRDNATGLVWEVKTTSGLHNASDYFSYYENGDDTLYKNRGVCYNTNGCDTSSFVKDVNSEKLCGFNDWRIPNIKELHGIVDLSTLNPAVSVYFNNVKTAPYWASTHNPTENGYNYGINFGTGAVIQPPKLPSNILSATYIILVRGKEFKNMFKIVNSEVVKDNATGLMWKRRYEQLTPEISTGPDASQEWVTRANRWLTWGNSNQPSMFDRAKQDRTLGYTDWRIPNVKELRSILDESAGIVFNKRLLNNTYFYETPFQGAFWTSTPCVDPFGNLNTAWYVDFDRGATACTDRGGKYYVLLVRDNK